MDQTHKDRAYRTLDGLRGVAALLVVTRHAGAFFPGRLFPESFMAVDLFFLLSGFVIACAYETRLAAGRSLGWFLKTRLIRLYPLYILGVAVGVAARVADAQAGGDPLDLASLGQALAIGVAMLPAALFLPLGGAALDGPTWTLAPELAANLVYAALLKWLSRRVLWAIVVLGGVALVAARQAYGVLDGGWTLQTLPLMAARLAFSFFGGVLAFRYRPRRGVRPAVAWACLAAAGAALAITPPPGWREAYELGVTLAVFPALLLTAAACEPGRVGRPVFAWLGAVSYGVYVLHHPLGALAATALDAFDLLPPASAVTGFAFLATVVMLAALADAVYDGPVRRWLTGLRRPERRSLDVRLRAGEA